MNKIRERLKIIECNITEIQVDAIVNAANASLLGGGGVDGAIHRAAGPMLLEECRSIGGCPTGEARITDGYNLPARKIIHTVGPVWSGGDNDEYELLSRCYTSSLRIAVTNNICTIAFPAISTGAFKFPLRPATRIAINTVAVFLEGTNRIAQVFFSCYDHTSLNSYRAAIKEYFK